MQLADAALPGAVTGAWVGGSISLGDYQRHSDIDLLIATDRPVPATELRRVRVSGVQAEWTTLASPFTGLAAITAATVHRHGIAIRGPRAAALVPDVDHPTLAAITSANVEAYWVPWLRAARDGVVARVTCLHPRRIEWGVVGVPRQLVTIAEGRIVSKTAGALYLRERVDARWHRIIDEALRLRRGERSLYRSPFERRRDMLAFLEHAIDRVSVLERTAEPR